MGCCERLGLSMTSPRRPPDSSTRLSLKVSYSTLPSHTQTFKFYFYIYIYIYIYSPSPSLLPSLSLLTNCAGSSTLFSADTPKGIVEAGSSKKIVFTLASPEAPAAVLAGSLPRPLQCGVANVVGRSDTVTVKYRILLQAVWVQV